MALCLTSWFPDNGIYGFFSGKTTPTGWGRPALQVVAANLGEIGLSRSKPLIRNYDFPEFYQLVLNAVIEASTPDGCARPNGVPLFTIEWSGPECGHLSGSCEGRADHRSGRNSGSVAKWVKSSTEFLLPSFSLRKRKAETIKGEQYIYFSCVLSLEKKVPKKLSLFLLHCIPLTKLRPYWRSARPSQLPLWYPHFVSLHLFSKKGDRSSE